MRCASLSIIVENTHARHVSQPLRIPRSAATKRTATGPIHLACTLSTHEAWMGTHVVRMWYACGTHGYSLGAPKDRLGAHDGYRLGRCGSSLEAALPLAIGTGRVSNEGRNGPIRMWPGGELWH